MDYIDRQLEYLLFLQNFRELSGHVLDNFFLNVTMFGEISIPLIVMCLIYWCTNKNTGIYIILSYLSGFIINLFLKCTFCIYRPWILDSRIIPVEQAMPAATGYSFPSGHTSGAVTVWGSIAIVYRKNRLTVFLCSLIIFLVMFSRNYLGVHTLQDIIVSFIVSILLLFIIYKLLEWEKKSKNRDLIIFLSVTIISIVVLLYVNMKSYPLDYTEGKLLYNPASVKTGAYYKTGWVIGVFLGWLLEKRFINFNPQEGKIVNKILRLVFGTLILFYLLSIETNSKILLFLIYFTAGLFITAVYPYIIKTIRKNIRYITFFKNI